MWLDALFLPGSWTHGLCGTLGGTSDGETSTPLPPHLTHRRARSEAAPCTRSTLLPHTSGVWLLLSHLTSFSRREELCWCSYPLGWCTSMWQQGLMCLFSSHLLFPFATQTTFWPIGIFYFFFISFLPTCDLMLFLPFIAPDLQCTCSSIQEKEGIFL